MAGTRLSALERSGRVSGPLPPQGRRQLPTQSGLSSPRDAMRHGLALAQIRKDMRLSILDTIKVHKCSRCWSWNGGAGVLACLTAIIGSKLFGYGDWRLTFVLLCIASLLMGVIYWRANKLRKARSFYIESIFYCISVMIIFLWLSSLSISTVQGIAYIYSRWGIGPSVALFIIELLPVPLPFWIASVGSHPVRSS